LSNLDHLTAAVVENVAIALSEDLGSGDITAELIPGTANARAIVVAREAMTLAGQPWVDEIYRQLDERVHVDWLFNDGDPLTADTELCIITGPARAVLTGERTALNFLQSLSATATVTACYVAAVAGTGARILDTRKTIPGLRHAQKYAVRCGGGSNHRIGLYDALLIKENHIISAGSIAAAVRAARDAHDDLPVEVEVESIAELRDALLAGADRLLLDNFEIDDLERAVAINQAEGNPPADLEASGGITIGTIRDVAATGVDYISVGALTKDVRAIDLSMRFRYAE
jgi:nicotinate-nucleotide pyrophosphorylase (carboxylating)